ncbi:MAG: TrmH family RNA methyltransferase [Pyrinomonadaceae bacterium]
MSVIKSRQNAKVKFAKRVAEGKERGLIFVEGARIVRETLPIAKRPELFVTEEFIEQNPAVERALARNIFHLVSDDVFSTIAQTRSPQGVAMICQKPLTGRDVVEGVCTKKVAPVVIFLVEVNNPNNLGAIFRTAEAADVAGIITSQGSTSVFGSSAIRASMGAAFRLPVWESAEFDEAIAWANAHSLLPTGLQTDAKLPYSRIDASVARLLVFGSESHGLGKSQSNSIETHYSIPMMNSVESLNLAVACGIVLFEINRTRTLSGAISKH